jgi:hypothetical protein
MPVIPLYPMKEKEAANLEVNLHYKKDGRDEIEKMLGSLLATTARWKSWPLLPLAENPLKPYWFP